MAAAAALSDTSFVQKLDAALAAPFKTGFADCIDLVFLVAAVRRGDRLLRDAVPAAAPAAHQSGIQAQQSGAGEITGTAVTPDVDGRPADPVGRRLGPDVHTPSVRHGGGPAPLTPTEHHTSRAASPTGEAALAACRPWRGDGT